MKYCTVDSQPQETLLNEPELIHTFCLCEFNNKSNLQYWIKKIIPHDKNANPKKWSNGGGAKRQKQNRLEFIANIEKYKNDIDFNVYCISSNEAQISMFTNAFYLENINNIHQEIDIKGRNCLVFKINEYKSVKFTALHAANLIWIFYCLKYLYEQKKLKGFIYSDWFANDRFEGEDKAISVSFINYLLKCSNYEVQLSISVPGNQRYDDIISDWFAGWSNSSRNNRVDSDIVNSFNKFLNENSHIIEWIEYVCNLQIMQKDG